MLPQVDTELNVTEIEAFCVEHLADYKRPKKIIIRDDLPKILIGKLAKQEIRKNLEEYLQ